MQGLQTAKQVTGISHNASTLHAMYISGCVDVMGAGAHYQEGWAQDHRTNKLNGDT